MSRLPDKYLYGVRRFLIGLFAVILVMFLFNFIDIFKAFELQVLDHLFKLRGKKHVNDNVVLLTVDDKTVRECDWPLPRRYYGNLVEQLNSSGAKVITFDFLLNDRTNQFDDSMLVYSIDESGNVINAFDFEVWSGEQNYDSNIKKCEEHFYSKYTFNVSTDNKSYFYRASTALFPHEDFIDFFEKAGHTTLIQDFDGHFRRIPLIIYFDGCYYPSLSLKTICEYFNIPDDSVSIKNSIWGNNLLLKTTQDVIKIPINKRGQALLNFYGDLSIFPQYSLLDVLQGRISTEYFRDKIVLIGKTVTGDKDTYTIPFSADFPGIGFHATLISNTIDRNIIREIPHLINFLILFFLGMLITFTPSKKSHSLLLSLFYALGIIIVVNIIGVCLFIFLKSGIWVNLIQSLAVVLFAFIGVLIFEKWEAYKNIKNIKEELKRNEQTIKEKENEIESLESRLENLQLYVDNNESLRKDLDKIQSLVSADVKEYLENIYKRQDNFKTAIQKQTKNIKILIDKREKEIEEREEMSSVYNPDENGIKKVSIGIFESIEIFTKEPRIIIHGDSGSTEKIRFAPQHLAFIYYLAKARFCNEDNEWIEGSEITRKDVAMEASKLYNHIGIVGCEFVAKGKKYPESNRSVVMEDFIAVDNEVRKNSSQINKKINKHLINGTPLIRTPRSEGACDGKYYLVKTIKKVVIHEDVNQ